MYWIMLKVQQIQIEWAHREAWGSTHMYKVCDEQKHLEGNKESARLENTYAQDSELCDLR